eukprot:6599452-Pyramimonas_sp.AAC.3
MPSFEGDVFLRSVYVNVPSHNPPIFRKVAIKISPKAMITVLQIMSKRDSRIARRMSHDRLPCSEPPVALASPSPCC